MKNNQGVMQNVILITIISIILAFTVGSIVYALIYDNITLSYKKIIELCASDNAFPDDQIKVEFTRFDLPSNSKMNGAQIRYDFRIKNVSDKSIDMKAMFFYDTSINQYIIPMSKGILLEEPSANKLESGAGSGYSIFISLSNMLGEYKVYELEKIKEASSKLYCKIELDKKAHYFVLDFSAMQVLSNV